MNDTQQSNSTENTTADQLFSIFRQLKTLTSVKDKEALLVSSKGQWYEDYLCELLHRNLNPYMMFHISQCPAYHQSRPPWKSGRHAYKEFIQLTDKLARRSITGNSARDAVAQFLSNTVSDEAEIYKDIMFKKAIGVGAKTVNKVWPNLVPQFDLMLAPNELPIITQVKFPIYVQPKVDDYRAVYVEGALWSRSGKPFANENLDEYFDSLFSVTDVVIDGGLYAHGISFNNLQKILNNQTAKLPKNLKFHVWDAVPSWDWKHQQCKLTYDQRLKLLRQTLNNTIADYKKVIDIPTDLVNTSQEAIELYKKYLSQGYEGAMLKAPDGLYKWKRVTVKSGEVLKLKPYKSADLEVKDIYDGEDGFQGMAGGVVVDFNGVAVRCGSGFDFDTRKAMAEQPGKYIGKVAEIKYLEVTEEGSLRHPIFERWREDKE